MSGKSRISDISKFFLVWLVAFCFIVPSVVSDQLQNSSLKVSVNLTEPFAMVSISPGEINLGEITRDYESEPRNISVVNIGTMDVKISPVLDDSSDEVFNYIKLSSASCSSWTSLGKWNSSIISHSQNYSSRNGEVYNFCMKLDLTNYTKTITPRNPSTNLIIWVMPA